MFPQKTFRKEKINKYIYIGIGIYIGRRLKGPTVCLIQSRLIRFFSFYCLLRQVATARHFQAVQRAALIAHYRLWQVMMCCGVNSCQTPSRVKQTSSPLCKGLGAILYLTSNARVSSTSIKACANFFFLVFCNILRQSLLLNFFTTKLSYGSLWTMLIGYTAQHTNKTSVGSFSRWMWCVRFQISHIRLHLRLSIKIHLNAPRSVCLQATVLPR